MKNDVLEISGRIEVGRFLQCAAMEQRNFRFRDFFGRSSFNRYYYALFLDVRKTIEHVDSSGSKLRHQSYPEFLRNTFIKKIASAAKDARKIGDSEKIGRCEALKHLTIEIAKTMEKAYKTRVTADYHPDIPLRWLGEDRFSLNEVNVTEAHEWHKKAFSWSNAVKLLLR